MTTTYTPDPSTYAWTESDRQYRRPYISPEARSGWYDGYGPMDRPNRIATPGPVVPSGNSASPRKGAVVAALVVAVGGGGALLGTFVFGDSASVPSPSVYMVPETNGHPAAPQAPEAVPPAVGAPTTIVVPGNAPAPTVIVPPASRGPAPAGVPAPSAPKPAAPRPANVPPPPPPAPAAPPQVRIEGIPIPIPVPGQTPGNQSENKQGQDQQGQTPAGDKNDECTQVPDLPYCKQGQDQGGQGQGDQQTGGAGGSAPDLGQLGTSKQDAGSATLQLPSSLTGAAGTAPDQNPCVDPKGLRNC